MFLEQLQVKNYFLLRAYQTAFEYLPESPLSVDINPFVFGQSIGLDTPTVTRLMQELVHDGHVSSGGGYEMMLITNRGVSYLQQLEMKSCTIKETEKQDIILKKLYEYRGDGKYYSITNILNL